MASAAQDAHFTTSQAGESGCDGRAGYVPIELSGWTRGRTGTSNGWRSWSCAWAWRLTDCSLGALAPRSTPTRTPTRLSATPTPTPAGRDQRRRIGCHRWRLVLAGGDIARRAASGQSHIVPINLTPAHVNTMECPPSSRVRAVGPVQDSRLRTSLPDRSHTSSQAYRSGNCS